MGYSAKITSITITFSSTGFLTGAITAEVQGIIAKGTLSHTRQSCKTLANGSTVSGISGATDSVCCYEINLPLGASNLDARTWGGSGDCDLIQIYHRSGFDNYSPDITMGTSNRISPSSKFTVGEPPRWAPGSTKLPHLHFKEFLC